jgi:hypothetical protein
MRVIEVPPPSAAARGLAAAALALSAAATRRIAPGRGPDGDAARDRHRHQPGREPGADDHARRADEAAGADNGSRAGYYTVKPGDTLIRIGLTPARTGKTWFAGTTSTTRT